MSYKPEVRTSKNGDWCGNGLAFATREEAEGNVQDLMQRWLLVTETRVVESDQPVNYKWQNGALVAVKGE